MVTEPVRDACQANVGVHRREFRDSPVHLEFTNISRSVENLSPEIGLIDGIEIAKNKVSDAAAGEVARRCAADAADADQQCGGGCDALLTFGANLRQSDVPSGSSSLQVLVQFIPDGLRR